ncbi:MAG: DUF5684 domain-containing protein [Eubacteriaceae bacterium]|jgi:hypothetical protein
MTRIIFSTIITILSVIGMWKMFEKAGEAGWKSLIPVYNLYILYKICWNTKMFWAFMICLVVAVATTAFGTGSYTSNAGYVLVLILLLVSGLGGLVLFVMQNVKLAESFGKGIGFGIGLVLLNSIFQIILGFDKSEYLGNQNDQPAAQN